MAKLAKAVYVKDPDRTGTVLLLPGEEPEPRLAALITNPEAWEGGKLPDAEPDKPAAKKPAAKKPATSRAAADEGSSGD